MKRVGPSCQPGAPWDVVHGSYNGTTAHNRYQQKDKGSNMCLTIRANSDGDDTPNNPLLHPYGTYILPRTPRYYTKFDNSRLRLRRHLPSTHVVVLEELATQKPR